MGEKPVHNGINHFASFDPDTAHISPDLQSHLPGVEMGSDPAASTWHRGPRNMAAILIIISGLNGLAAAIIAGLLGVGFFGAVLSYAIAGNLSFAILSGLAIGRSAPTVKPDFVAEIEADLAAMLEERNNALFPEGATQRKKRARAEPTNAVFYAVSGKGTARPSVFRPR